MVTMIDELYDRHYRDARFELNRTIVRGLARLGGAIDDAFQVLVDIEYQTPWAARSKRARCN